jgi:hypothetical protein
MVIAIIANLFIIATGVVACIVGGFGPLTFAATAQNINASWAIMFFAIGLIIFGILGILGELQIKVFIQGVAIFHAYWSRAIWYIIMGFFCLGLAGALGIASAIIVWVVAIMMLIFWCIAR